MEKLKGKKPNIRFPEFKDDWQHTKLSELLSEAKKRNEDLKYGKDEVLSVSGELGIVNQIEHLGRSYAGASVHNYHVVETGDIVYTKSPLKANPFGIIKLNKGKAGIVSTLYAVYKVNDKTCYGPWLDYYFSLDANTNRYLRPLVKKGAKNDMKINNAYVLHDRIFAPSIPEQKRIAAFFTVVDKKIAELKQKKALLEQYKKGVMQKLFSQELRFKDENGKEFPKWKKTQLIEFLIPTIREVNKPNSSYLSVGVKSHFRGTFHKAEVDPDDNQMETLYQVKKNDLILNITFAWEGALAIAKEEDDNGYVSHRFPTYTFNQGMTSHSFFKYCFFNSKSKHELTLISPGGAGRNRVLNKKDFLKLHCLLPCIDEQNKISGFLSKIDERLEGCEKQLLQFQEWKKSLVQNMFCNG